MSKNLKENQVLAANLIAIGLSTRTVSKELNIREETVCRWKKNINFKRAIKQNQKNFLSKIEKKHFSILQKAIFNIDKALEDEGFSIKEKAELSIKYLKTTASFLSKNINDYNFKIYKAEQVFQNNKENDNIEKQIDQILQQIAESKRRLG